MIVTHLHLAPAALAFAARGASLTTMLCGVEAWQPVSRPQRAALERAARLIAISRYTRDGFQQANPRFADRASRSVISASSRWRTPSGAGDGPPSALIVGRMAADERYKGHDALLEIWADVAAAVPGASLRIVGDGDDRARLEQKAAALGLGDRVVFLGRLDDEALEREYRGARPSSCPVATRGSGSCSSRRCGRPVPASAAAARPPRSSPTEKQDCWSNRRSRAAAAGGGAPAGRSVGDRGMGERGRARFLQQFTEARFRDRFTALLPVAS